VCCYLVFNSSNVSNIGLYVSFMYKLICFYLICICSIFLEDWGVSLFSLFLRCPLCRLLSRMHVLCSIYDLNIPNYCYYSWLPVCAPCIWYGIFDPFDLYISIENLGISFRKRQFFVSVCLWVELQCAFYCVSCSVCYLYMGFFEKFCNFPCFFTIICSPSCFLMLWIGVCIVRVSYGVS
jgi:hypothetical protein